MAEARSPVTTPTDVTAVVDTDAALVVQWVAAELGNSSYLAGDRRSGQAVVIDPWRDVDGYLGEAAARGWRVASTVDTHVHNDFISGGPVLRAVAGAKYLVPEGGGIEGADRELRHGDELSLGALRLRAIHSPGHTSEHLSYLLLDGDDEPLALFSGGALMVGTMARPDLLGPSHLYELSRSGREALRSRLLSLPDEVCVLPTHGGGSFCGAASSTERTTTIARERATNPLATAPDFAHFLAIHAKQGRYPAYYARMAPRNRAADSHAPELVPSKLDIDTFDRVVAAGAVVVDCRPYQEFDGGHVPDALSVPVDGPFSAWVGWVVDIDSPIVLVAATAAAAEDAQRQLVRIGCKQVHGWLDQADWTQGGRTTRGLLRCTMGDLAERVLDGDRLTVVDVRQESEWAAGHLPGAVHAMSPDLPALAAELDHTAPVAVHCATGYRSALGASLLLRLGVADVWHVTDGVEAWTALGHPLVTVA